MTNYKGMRGAVCFAALIAGGAAQADVTAGQVWEDWKQNLTLYGANSFTVGSEVTSGNTLTVSDVAMNVSDEFTQLEANLGEIVFTELGNGTVKVAMAESYPMTVTGDDDTVVSILATQSGLEIIVSGAPGEMTYAVDAEKFTMAVEEIQNRDVKVDGDIRIVANNINGTSTTSSTGDLRHVASGVNLSSVDMLVDMQLPESQYVVFSGKLDGISMQSDMTMPLDTNYETPEEMFSNGFAVEAGYAINSANYIFDINVDGEQMAGSASTGATKLDGEFNQNVARYDVLSNDIALSFTGGGIPFPIEIDLAQYGLGFEMPLGKSEEPADFGLSLNLQDLAVNDMIWDMIDAGKVLPHDPATLQFDLAGKARLFFDLLDPAQAEELAKSDIPGELNTLSLKSLKLALAGALITGEGDFTFDNTDLETFDGMPRPEGEVNFELTGINGLIDNLVSMGLVPEDQAMMGRMMMGMFARTTGEDQLSSKFEINEQGHVLANGQRIQ